MTTKVTVEYAGIPVRVRLLNNATGVYHSDQVIDSAHYGKLEIYIYGNNTVVINELVANESTGDI
jgi:hypothetical protein